VGRTPLRQISKHLNNKNATMPEIRGPPWQFFLKALTPLGILSKNIRYPLPWIFNPCASMAHQLNFFFFPLKFLQDIKIFLKEQCSKENFK
jgi:hypothetical protein